MGLTPQRARGMKVYRGTGCQACFQTGYRGRTGIFELFRITDPAKNLILSEAPQEDLFEQARKDGMSTLMESGIEKVKNGVTSVDELLRVTVA
jgi:type IV pilus assembly protein PilB